jgi:Zn-dependent protease
MPSQRLNNFLNWSWPLFRYNRYNVSIHWTMFLFLLWWMSLYSRIYGPWIGGGLALVLGLTMAMAHYFVIFVHEMGHGGAARRRGHVATEVMLTPLGGELTVSPRGPTDELVITAWGPLQHVWLLLPALPLFGLVWMELWQPPLFFEALVRGWVYLNLFMLLFNLLPAYPMDGGRMLRAYLAQRMYAGRATIIACHVSLLTSIGMIVYAFLQLSGVFIFLLGLIALRNIMACEQEKTMVREVDPYGGGGGEGYDLSGYYTSQTDAGAQHSPGLIGRWMNRMRQRREARRRREREKQERKEQALREKVDRLLEKVGREGLNALSPEERDFLRKASDTYRRK